MSGYKDYLSEEMQGAIETPTKSKRTRLSQFRHGGYHSSMDEFFTAGKKSYGVRNVDVAQLGKYSSTGRATNPRFSTAEFFGKTFMSNGGEVTVYNNPGNLEKGQEYAGETGNTYADDRERPFVIFDSPQMGVRALAMDLRTKIKRHDGDVNKIIAQYAPDNENDTEAYQKFVKEKLKKDKVTDKDLKYFVQAIIEKENKPEVVDYYFDNPNIVKEGVAMSFYQLPEGITLEEARKNIINQLPKKKPKMNEGGSVKKQMAEALNEDAPKGERLAYINPQEEKMLKNAGGSGELTEAGIPSYRGIGGYGGGDEGPASGGGNTGGNTGGNNGGNNGGGQGGSFMDSGEVQESLNNNNNQVNNQGGGQDAGASSSSGDSGAGAGVSQDVSDSIGGGGPANPNLQQGAQGTVSTTTKKAVKKANNLLNNSIYGTYNYTTRNTNFFGNPIGSTITAINEGIKSAGNVGVYGSLFGNPTSASLGIQNTLSPENVQNLNFAGTETDLVGNLNTNVGNYNIDANVNFGEDTGTLGINRDFDFNIGNQDINATVGAQIDEQGNVTPTVAVSFKKGGLLDRSR